ncbi:hypothetical protein J2R95_003193 [Bradyrhizobium japonicum]|uniref:phage tail tip lysozyme n=1 Tax=Bradyrhizobium japonicum TaxID=375 RepID=UPI0020A0E37C|nr:phage tail tip lysozyme [Bradyrhizobium japonicum]MCP1937398.1 hypothetical protein [Bradyrhizobium japonicum]
MIGGPNRATQWLTWAQQPREQGGLGLAPHQAAGIVGNLVHESGQDLSPWGPTGDNGTAWGTAQWRGDRLARLKQLPNYQTVEGQQAFMREELDGSENKAYRALQAAKTPEEAAHAWDALYERSDGSTRSQRMASARQLMAQFGGGAAPASEDPGALTTSFAPTEKTSMPALSADNTLGPGALNPEGQKSGLFGLNVSDNTYDGLMGIASSLSGISNPEQAKALIAQQAANKKAAGDTGTWSVQTLPDGTSFYFNNKSGRRVPIGNFAKPEADKYKDAAEVASAKSNQDYGDGLASAAANANGMAGDVGTLRQVLSNPAVYQGQGGEWVQSARKLYAGITGDTEGAKNIADGDIARALSNKLALKLVQDTGNGKLLPGSFSDSDRKFVQQMSTSLDNSPGANQRLLDIYERSIARAQQADQVRQQHLDANGGIYRPSVRGEVSQLQKKWADEDKVRGEAEAKAPAAAPAAKPAANTFKTKSGVTWSVH